MDLILELLGQLNEEVKPPKKNITLYGDTVGKMQKCGFKRGDFVEITAGVHKGQYGYALRSGVTYTNDTGGAKDEPDFVRIDISKKSNDTETVEVAKENVKLVLDVMDNPIFAKVTDKLKKETDRKSGLYKTSDGKEADFNLTANQPNMTWTGDPLKVGNKFRQDFDPSSKTGFSNRNQVKKRTAAEIKETKDIVETLKKDIDGMKKHMEDTNQMSPHTKEKNQMFKNSYVIYEASKFVADNIDAFYNELLRLNIMIKDNPSYRVEKDLKKAEEAFLNIKKLCYEAGEWSKKARTKMALPKFVSPFRTQSAQELAFMLHARDFIEKTLKRLEMSPAKLAAAKKTSARMKDAWRE